MIKNFTHVVSGYSHKKFKETDYLPDMTHKYDVFWKVTQHYGNLKLILYLWYPFSSNIHKELFQSSKS